MASAITRIVEPMEAQAELISDGHGLAPDSPPKKARYPSRVSGAKMSGGLEAASISEWKLVSTMYSTGVMNKSPMSQVSTVRADLPSRFLLAGLLGAGRVAVMAPVGAVVVICRRPWRAGWRRSSRRRWR